MTNRLELHEKLCSILGTRNVYFQPPSTVKMKYPAILYTRQDIRNTSADNEIYKQDHNYQIIVIDSNPDSEIVDNVSKIPGILFDRHYVSENLNHDVFTLFYK